jgi:hypothetical protein
MQIQHIIAHDEFCTDSCVVVAMWHAARSEIEVPEEANIREMAHQLDPLWE